MLTSRELIWCVGRSEIVIPIAASTDDGSPCSGRRGVRRAVALALLSVAIGTTGARPAEAQNPGKNDLVIAQGAQAAATGADVAAGAPKAAVNSAEGAQVAATGADAAAEAPKPAANTAVAAPDGPQPSVADAAGTDSGEMSQVTVTGSRIVRSGFTAPTPLTVVGSEQVQQQATPNLIDYLTTLPAFSGNYTPQESTQNVSTGTAGTSSVNLRNLGANRTLVLIDGQRVVPSTVTGLVDINAIPEQLIQRVEVVTGGASAAYGSDAVSGVVNFILDKKFTGLKTEVSGGITNYGDDPTVKFSITGGTPFASGRGHLILSGQFSDQGGVLTGDRPWDQLGWQVVNNPSYEPGNGQPQRLLLNQVSASDATPGGIIVSGPLRGVAFGPGGSPYMFNYGPLSTNSFTQGGSWQASSLHLVGQSIEPKLNMKNLFGRASFDVTDNTEMYVQLSGYENEDLSHAYPNEYFGGVNVSVANPYLPASVHSAALAAGLTDADQLTLGTTNGDLGTVTIDTQRKLLRGVFGFNGKFDMFNTNWTWDAYYEDGSSQSVEEAYNSVNLVRFSQATDAVVGPTGAIVCRSTLTTPTDGCVPYNVFGTGVNTAAAINYVAGTQPHREETFNQKVEAASISGTPFSSWAGPVSLAAGVEHRRESVTGVSTPDDLAGVFFAGNYIPTFGSYEVTEGFLETLLPLAEDLPGAKSLELNAAARATDYSTSGYVTTWKAGLTYKPIQDVMFRMTRSRDIRAPNLNDLFNSGSKVNDLVVNDATGQAVAYQGTTEGNLTLKPEEADSTGFGVVLQPSFIRGLSVSVDYWNIDLKGAIDTISAQNIEDLCFEGNHAECEAINGGNPLTDGTGANRNEILIQPFNLANQLVRGVDYEGTYRLPMSVFGQGLDGDLAFRVLATNFLKIYTNNTLTPPTDVAGDNYGGTPHWRWNSSVTYDYRAFSGTLSARGVSAGTRGNQLIQCTSDCPVSTVFNPTINDNHVAGEIFLDVSVSYIFMVGKSGNGELQTFMNIRNVTNRNPVIDPGGPSGLPYDTVTTNPEDYDTLGRVFNVGVRLKF